MDGPRERWLDRDAGPLVRLYTLTRGRTRPTGARLDLLTILVATWNPVMPGMGLVSEHHELRALCREPATVADLAAEMDLPVTIVQVLLGDLYHHGLLQQVPQQIQEPASYDIGVLEDVIRGLDGL